MSRSEITRRFGIDVGEDLEWRGWIPGGEYVKKVVVKNVSTDVIAVQYKLPETKFFYMKFPKAVKLAPGNSFTVDVSFRPIKSEEYNDAIEFITVLGSFFLPVRARLLERSMIIPELFDFGFCPVKEITELTFDVKNNGQLHLNYEWKYEAPFKIFPSKGGLAPGQSLTVTIQFFPMEASVFVSSISCQVADLGSLIMKISGISKYPYITVSDSLIQFGDVLTESTVEKEFLVINHSNCSCDFNLTPVRTPNQVDVFNLITKEKRIPANSSITVKCVYKPLTSGTFSSDFFDFTTPGGNSTQVQVTGNAIGAAVRLSSSELFFGDVELGQKSIQTVQLNNDSNSDLYFEIPPSIGSFLIEPSFGVIPRKLYVTICISFERTCFSEKSRPSPLTPAVVSRYWRRIENGLGLVPPDNLLTTCLEKQINPIELGFTEYKGLVANLKSPFDTFLPSGHNLFFLESESIINETIVRDEYLNFGFGYCLKKNDSKMVVVTNRTRGKMTLVWDIPANCPFNIHPAEADIPPLGSSQFTLSFRPTIEDHYYLNMLEGYCYYKNQRSFRLVKPDDFTPPHRVQFLAAGHTFVSPQFIPNGALPAFLAFPPCISGRKTYITVTLSNHADTPLAYNFIQPILQHKIGSFTVKPSAGLIAAHGFACIVFRFSANSVGHASGSFQLNMNGSMLNFPVFAAGFNPVLEVEKELFFPPTCLAVTSNREFYVQNHSRIPVAYRWNMFGNGEYSVSPEMGILFGNERQRITVQFTPNSIRKHESKMKMLYSPLEDDDIAPHNRTQLDTNSQTVLLHGICNSGSLVFIPEEISLGVLLIGVTTRRIIKLSNVSDYKQSYRLSCPQSNSHIVIEPSSGVLPARSCFDISIAFTPLKTQEFSMFIEIYLGENISLSSGCHIKAVCELPKMQISDLRMEKYSTLSGWESFSVDALNNMLSSTFTEFELSLQSQSTSAKALSLSDYVAGLQTCDLKFESSMVGNEPEVCYINFCNQGHLPINWSFKFPADLEMEADRWAEKGEYTPAEIQMRAIEASNVFSIVPMKGDLNSGESVIVRFAYQHLTLGQKSIPALFSVSNGKTCIFNLIGNSVDIHSQYLAYSNASNFELIPIKIGTKTDAVPEQYYKLSNTSAWDINYTVSISNNQEHGIDVFWIPFKEGVINSMSTSYIPMYFRPLTCKEYNFVITITPKNLPIAEFKVDVHGVGYVNAPLLWRNPTSFPIMPTMILPPTIQYGSLSNSLLDFGLMPLRTLARRMIVLENTSSNVLSYMWEGLGDVVAIEPKTGLLQPGDNVMCRVILTSGIVPLYLDRSVTCILSKSNTAANSEKKRPVTNSASNTARSFSSAGMPYAQSNLSMMKSGATQNTTLNQSMLSTSANLTRNVTSSPGQSRANASRLGTAIQSVGTDIERMFESRSSYSVYVRILALICEEVDEALLARSFSQPLDIKKCDVEINSRIKLEESEDLYLFRDIMEEVIRDVLESTKVYMEPPRIPTYTEVIQVDSDNSIDSVIIEEEISNEFKSISENIIDSAIFSVLQELRA